MKSTQNVLFVLFILAVFGVTACSNSDSGSETFRFETTLWELISYTADTAKADGPSIIPSLWRSPQGTNSQRLNVISVLSGSTITAIFDGGVGQVYGSSGCNQYTGSFTVDGTTLSISKFAVTLMSCNEPAGVMEQEQWYLATLEAAESYEIQGRQLQIFSSESRVLLYVAR